MSIEDESFEMLAVGRPFDLGYRACAASQKMKAAFSIDTIYKWALACWQSLFTFSTNLNPPE